MREDRLGTWLIDVGNALRLASYRWWLPGMERLGCWLQNRGVDRTTR